MVLWARRPCFYCKDAEIKARDPQFNGRPTGPPTGLLTTSTTSSIDSSTTSDTSTRETSTTSFQTSTFSTTTSSSITPTSHPLLVTTATSTSPTFSSTATAVLEQTTNASSGPSTGIIAAAVAIPVLVLLLLLAVFMLLRRKRRTAEPVMQERGAPFIAPVMINNTNTAYYTGLDTGSEFSGDYYGRSDASSYSDPPPPPYKAATHIPTAASSTENAIPGVPLVRLPTGMPNTPPSPVSWATPPRDAAYLDSSSATRSDTASRSGSIAPTEQSINSDLYSDDASVHSARAARLSVAGLPVDQDFNPFDDPSSPVSSVDGEETRSLTSLPSRSISPVSRRSA